MGGTSLHQGGGRAYLAGRHHQGTHTLEGRARCRDEGHQATGVGGRKGAKLVRFFSDAGALAGYRSQGVTATDIAQESLAWVPVDEFPSVYGMVQATDFVLQHE